LGISALRTDTINGWNSLIRDQRERFRNFPRNAKGRQLELKDFLQIPGEELGVWRDHLVDSFTEGSGCKHPFQVIDKDGKTPILNVLRMGSNNGDEESKKGQKIAGKPPQNKESKNTMASKHGRKRKSKATIVDDPDNTGNSEDHNEFDAGHSSSEVKAAKSPVSNEVSESPRKHLARRAAPRPASRPTSNSASYSDATLSYFLQINSMEGTTLPADWKRIEFSPDKVC
jgi:hypothetical protein